VAEHAATDAADLAATLVAALAVNVSIVGVNQITDVEIDRINKPYLPIAAGDLTLPQAKAIVAAATALPLAMALTQGAGETVAVVSAYLGMAIAGPILLRDNAAPVVLAGGQLAALTLLCVWARAADPRDQAAFTRFYMRVWGLFFLEYLLVPLACLAA